MLITTAPVGLEDHVPIEDQRGARAGVGLSADARAFRLSV
jgi:hypothetical protein